MADNPGAGKYRLAAERMDTRDDKKVLHQYRKGDEVELDAEQAQRLVAAGAVMSQADWDKSQEDEGEPEAAPQAAPRAAKR